VTNRPSFAPGANISEVLQAKYDDYYEGANEWRRVGAQDKVRNLEEICKGQMFRDVVDVGAGEGSILSRLDEIRFAPNLYALEISRSGVQAIEQRRLSTLREVHPFDGYTIPYPDKRFDLALASHVLEHVEHERLLLRELKRVASKVFIEVPLEDTLRIAVSLDNDIGHINFYRQETLLALLKSVGLRPLRWRVFDYSLAVGTYRLGLVKGVARQAVRRAALRVAPRLAQTLFTYHLAVLAEAEPC
jgi:SAM-dependent methyltransferase